MKKGKRFKPQKFKRLLIFLSIAFILAISYLIFYYYTSYKNKTLYENIVKETETNTEIVKTEKQDSKYIQQVKKLQKENSDVKGWIQIEDTQINYPLLQGNDNSYYISHNYKKEKDQYGSIMLNPNSDLDDKNSNIIIYGHHMQDGQMFQNLLKYTSKDFYKKHKIVKLATDKEEREYQIIYAFKSKVFHKSDKNVFRYYQAYQFENEKQYNEYLENCKKIELYNTGETANYGEQLLTLITCEYSRENGRMVVVAKRIK